MNSKLRKTVTVVQLGSLKRAEVESVIRRANMLQDAFFFDLSLQSYPLKSDYLLSNEGFDLDAATRNIRVENDLSGRTIFVTGDPYGYSQSEDPEYFFFNNVGLLSDPEVAIVSTYLWESLPGKRTIESYLFYSFAVILISLYTDLTTHRDTLECLFDWCENPEEIDVGINGDGLCKNCQRDLNNALRGGSITLSQVAAAMRLFNMATGRKLCFVAFPFSNRTSPVYPTVVEVLEGKDWKVLLADQLVQPRRITDAILQAIMTSELVIADITGSNPNVFYEVGVAHATGRDVILITKESVIPFDVANERAIIYEDTEKSLKNLKKELHHLV